MENCLVSKLKESVNNDNLPVLGCLRLRKNSVSSTLSIKNKALNVTSSIPSNIFGDNSLVSGGSTFSGKINLPVGRQASSIVYTMSGTSDGGYVDLSYKDYLEVSQQDYQQLVLYMTGINVEMTLETFLNVFNSSCVNAAYNTVNYQGSPKLSTLISFINTKAEYINSFKIIDITLNNITNDVADSAFNNLTALTDLSAKLSSSFDYEALASAQVANGRTSGSLRVYGIRKLIRFDSSVSGGYTVEDY